MAKKDDQEFDDQVDDQNPDGELVEGEEEGDSRPANLGWTGWLISGTFHVIVLMLFGLIYWAVKEEEVDTPPVRVASIERPPEPEKKVEDTTLTPTELPLDVPDATVDKPSPISQLDLPVDVQAERETDSDNPIPKGREEAVADAEMGSQGAFMAIGAGGGGSGMFGSRTGGGKRRAIGKFGGSKGSESAVTAALEWFKRHQDPDGKWDPTNYPKNCTEDPKCEPGTTPEGGVNAITGYAVLCFLGAGFDHVTPNRYKQTVKKGLDHLIRVQAADGSWGRNYEHPVVVMALAEAYAMTGDNALKAPTQKGVDLMLARQNKDPKAADPQYAGLGWDYMGPSTRNDSSVTGWNVMALKSALAAQLNVGNGMEGSKKWLELAWKATNKNWDKLDPYKDVSRFPYTWTTGTDQVDISDGPADNKDLASAGGTCAVFLGRKSGDVMLETLVNYALKHQLPKQYPTNTYYLYYNTLACFQAGGEKWKTWNSSVRDLLVNAQRKEPACFRGSWDVGNQGFHGHETGRTLITAYATLSLEVYYRYAQVAGAAAGGAAR